MVSDDGVGMGGAIVEELCECAHGCFGSFGLLGGKSSDGRQHGGVNGTSIKEECAEDCLDVVAVGCIEGRSFIGRWGILGFCAVVRFLPCVGRVLRARGGRVLETL